MLLSHSVLQERSCTLVEFMRLVENAIGADVLVQALAACRIATQRKAAAQAAAPPSSEAAEEKSERSTAKAGAAGQNPANLDVAQEAEDVLAIAGVNPDDEAKLLFGDQVELSKADVFFHPKDKDQWRKLIELRIFARICGDKGLAVTSGISHVNEKVYEFIEEALQVRLKGFIAKISECAARRNDANRVAFDAKSVVEPKHEVRAINVELEQQKLEREEKERQALLRFGESVMSKRKRADLEDNAQLKEKVARARQEEEERRRALVANQAAQAALGDTRAQKWLNMAKSDKTASVARAKPRVEAADGAAKAVEENKSEKPAVRSAAANMVATNSITLRDCVEALKGDERSKTLRSRLLGKMG